MTTYVDQLPVCYLFSVSEAPEQPVKERKYEKFDATEFKTDEQKRNELVSIIKLLLLKKVLLR